MKKIRFGILSGIVAVLICGAAMLVGCSITVMPNNVPLIKGFETRSLKGVSLIVANAEKDATEYDIRNDRGDNSGLRTNRRAWSAKLVESLAGELARRGARVESHASLTLSITLPEIIFTQTRDLYQFKVKVLVSSSRVWSKNYEGIAESGLIGIESTTSMTNRLAGQALQEAVKAMLDDAEFLARLSADK